MKSISFLVGLISISIVIASVEKPAGFAVVSSEEKPKITVLKDGPETAVEAIAKETPDVRAEIAAEVSGEQEASGKQEDDHKESGSGVFNAATALGVASVMSLLCYMWYSQGFSHLGNGLSDAISHFTEFVPQDTVQSVAGSASEAVTQNVTAESVHPLAQNNVVTDIMNKANISLALGNSSLPNGVLHPSHQFHESLLWF